MKSNPRARCARTNRALEEAWGAPDWPGLQNPVDVLVKTILSQSAPSSNSERAWNALKAAYPTWDEVAAAKTESVARVLRRGGIAKMKTKFIVKMMRDIKKEYGSVSLDFMKNMSVREAMRALGSIEGVDPKIGARVILFALGREICPVGTHIHRILQRMGIIPATATPEMAFELLQPLVPKGQAYAFHVNLIRLGREVCRAGKPKCNTCPVETECRYPGKTMFRDRR